MANRKGKGKEIVVFAIYVLQRQKEKINDKINPCKQSGCVSEASQKQVSRRMHFCNGRYGHETFAYEK